MVNTDYTFNGEPISESFVIEAAEVEGLSVDEYVNQKDGLEIVEVTEEIQTEPKGKTNDVATVDAAVTSEPDTASESTESEPDDILSGLEEIKDVREIDKRIDKITSTKATKFFEAGEISPLDSPKRIAQYKELINRRNNIIGDTYKLGQTQQYQQLDFDPMSPAKIPLEKEGAPEGGVKLAYVPFTVDGEVVGTTMEPVGLQDVVVTAEQYKQNENQIQSEAYKNFLKQSGLSTEPLSREEFEAERLKLGTITDASEPEYKGLDPIQAFENIGTMLSSFQQTAQEKENYRSQYKNYLKKLGNLNPDVKRKLPGFLESTLGSTANMFLQIGGVDDRALYNLSFIMSTVPDDVYANVFGKDLGADLKKEAIKGFSNIDKKINDLNSLTSDTVGFTDVGDVESVLGKTGAIVGGSYNAVTSFAASYVTNVATAGVGLASDMIANSIKTYNDELAIRENVTVEELIASGKAEVITPAFLGILGYSLEKAGLDKVGSIISTGLKQGTAKSLVSLLTAGGAEGTTEYLQGLVETYNVSLGQGLSTEDALEKVRKELTSKESLERVLQGAVGGSGIVLGSQGLKAVSALRSPVENKKLTQIINQLNELENSKFRKNLTADDIAQINTAQEELRFNLKNIVDNNNELISTLTPAQIQQVDIASDYLTSSTSRINEIKASDKYSEQDKENIIASINQKRKIASDVIYDIRNEAEKLEAQVFTIKDLSKFVKGVKVEEAKDDAEALKFVDENNLEIKASTEQGYILQNPETGEQTIVINKETAQNQQAVNVAAHEFLHALLYSTIKNNPKAATNLGKSLMAELNKIDIDQIEDSDFKKRMRQYADKPLEEQMEEAITLFSDALVTGDIKFKENIATRIGNKFRRLSQKFGVKIKFNNGRDVYNFVKDYNKSVEKGELSIAQVRAAAEGVEGELVSPKIETFVETPTIKESKKTPKGQEFISLVDEGILTNESLVDVVKSPSSTQEDKFGAIEAVVEKNWPVISKAVKFNPTGSIPMDAVKEAVTEQIQGIFPGRGTALFDTYNPETSKVNTFIGSTLGPRQAEILERAQAIGGRTQAADITEARGIVAGKTKTQEPTTTRSQIDVRKFGPAKDKVSEISKIVKVKEGNATSYKDLTNEFLDKVSMEVFNVPGKKIAGRATLTDAEAKSLQRLFVAPDNVRKLIKTMPPYNVATSETTIGSQAEIIDVSRDIKGKSIGLSNKFIEKYYQPVTTAIPGISNAKGRSLGTTSQTQVYELKPEYTGRITNEIVQQVQNDVGVTERGIPNEKISAENRSKYGTTLTGFAKTYIANAINVSARAKQTSKQEQADTGAGKARLMFSKEVDSALTPGQSQNIGKVFNKLGNQEKITFVQNIDPFFDAITKDDYNVETAFNNIFGSDFLKGKKKQDFINEWSKVRGSLVDLKNYNKGKPKKTTVQDYLYQAFEEQTQSEVVENILGVKKGGVNFRSKDQLMGYVNFINSYIAKKAESLNDFELAEFVINDLGPTLSAGAKVGGNDFMWQRDADTDLLVLVPSTLDRSNSIRTSLFGNQREMAEVLIKPFISDKSKLTYKGNKPLWDGVPLLKKGYKVDQSVNTYLTSIKKNGGITNEMLDKSQEYADKQVKNIIDILDYYKSLPKDSETTIDDLGMFFRASNGDMTAMVRAAANVDSFAGDGKGAYRYEHNPPARTMLVRMAEYVNGTITKQELKNEFDKYTVSIIPQQMDDVINERYKDTVPLVGSRYYNAFTYGRFPFAMNVYKKQSDGSYKTETIGEYQKQAYESQIKLSRSNNDQLMPVVKFAKKVPNSEVLNRMGELDADAKQANKEFYNSVDLNKEFNDILEVKTGIASEKRYKQVKAEVVGANKGRFQFFIPPSAEDFTGLLYSTLAKGKLGDAQMAWYKKNLLDPYGKAMNELSSARIAMMNDYKQLKKELEIVPKDLRKKVPGEPFTREQAVRVYIWQKQGMSVPGISEADMQDLSDFVANDTELQLFAEQLINIQKGDQYAGPKEGWPAGTITTDMLEGLNTTKRAKALEQWQANADEIFSEANLNKLEAAYGKPYRKAMENMLQRMKSGRNRNFQGDTLTGRFTDWVTGSIGTIMFFNTRSALLQTISSINFVNFTDNNILAAGKAFANQKQFWSDFMTLMNSDFLKERRGGLRINVSEADIADMAKKGGAKGVINKLLEFGFTPTQIADSFAIASGGAAFYRNRIKSLKKQGMTDAEAEAQAFVDFRETAEESQQSSRPDRISMQQAGPLGRLVLAFANTPAQYARLIKKAASDLKNGRGDAKTNISKIIYYGVAQNLLFNALQQALFAFAFDDDEEDTEEKQKKYVGIANGMMDSLLRGMGIGGAAVSVGKNAIIRIINEMEKKQPKLEKVGYEITKLSPPISAKLSRINQAARSYQWDKKDMMEKGWSLDNPAYLAGANVVAALTNIPLDRAVKKTNNVVQATSQDLETWERLALLGGWQDWEIGIDEEKSGNKPQPRKTKSTITKKRKLSKR